MLLSLAVEKRALNGKYTEYGFWFNYRKRSTKQK